jgi:small subunit ribosomal protein S9
VQGAEEMAEAVEAAAEEAPSEDVPSEAAPAEGQEPPAEEPAVEELRKERRVKEKRQKEEVIPGAHLEPDLVLEEERQEAAMGELAGAEVAAAEEVLEEPAEAAEALEPEPAPEPAPRKPIDLAADARYVATGKRKSAVARVVLKPGEGGYSINGRGLDEFFPRIRLQMIAKQPLETAGYGGRMDVVAKIHGGGVAAQAGALRHGIARALVEADPNLRVELKRRGYLTRDPRVKERKKAGLKKARKRPQFSKR